MILKNYLLNRKISKEIETLNLLYSYLSTNRKDELVVYLQKEFNAERLLDSNYEDKLNKVYSSFLGGKYIDDYKEIWSQIINMETYEDGLNLAKMFRKLSARLRKEIPFYCKGISFANTFFITMFELVLILLTTPILIKIIQLFW